MWAWIKVIMLSKWNSFTLLKGEKKKKKSMHVGGRRGWVCGVQGFGERLEMWCELFRVCLWAGWVLTLTHQSLRQKILTSAVTSLQRPTMMSSFILSPAVGEEEQGDVVGGLYHTHHVRRDFDQAPESVRRFSLEHFVIIRCQKLWRPPSGDQGGGGGGL